MHAVNVRKVWRGNSRLHAVRALPVRRFGLVFLRITPTSRAADKGIRLFEREGCRIVGLRRVVEAADSLAYLESVADHQFPAKVVRT